MLSFSLAGNMIAGDAVPALAGKEVAKRMAQMQEAQAQVVEAASLYGKGDNTGAMKLCRQAFENLPDAPLAAQLKNSARDGYSQAANTEARKLATEARYAEAKDLLKSVLQEDFDPGNADARLFAKQIDDPERFEPALTPKHLANVAEVNKLLRMGEGLLSLGDFDKAVTQFQAVLRIDPYNSAARRDMERLEQMKSSYFDAARDHTRAKRLGEVAQGWEDAVPPSTDVTQLFGGGSVGTGSDLSAKKSLLAKIRSIVFPKVDLQGVTLDEVVEYLRIQSRDLDSEKKGVSFVVRAPPEAKAKTVTLNLNNAPLEELLRYITEMTGTAYRIDEFAVNITSLADKSDALILKSYRVPPDFMANSAIGDSAPTAPVDPFAGKKPATQSGGLLSGRRIGAREMLEQRGITFPAEATASYNPASSMLFVRNTQENIALIDDLVEQATGAAPKLVEIIVKLIEVNSTRLNELGFDWLMGQANIPGSSGAFGSGGTIGNQRAGGFTNNEFPFTNPGGSLVGTFPVTSGLRSSGDILGPPSIDGLIQGGLQQTLDSRSPGQFSIAGVFTDPQFQTVIRTLSQSKGVELLAAPAVVTKSGQRASVKLVREFPYPTEYTPPQIPTTVGAGAGIRVPITPATPSAFQTRPVGIEVEVEPVIGDNNRRVDLAIVPSSVDFEGFINYGQDITLSSTKDILGNPVVVKQPNNILQPVFRTNKITTSVSVWDGNTIAIGGVISDKHSKIQDKVPVVGNIPLIGRSFQSKVTLMEKKSVVFFVTVHVLDPSGSRINQAGHTVAAP